MGRLPENTNMNPRSCPICRHPERAEIERMVLSMSASNPSLTLDAIADAFGISVRELRVHTLMHTPLALDFSAEAETALIDDFKLRAGQPLAESTSTQGADSVSHNAHSGQLTPRQRLADRIDMREGDMLLAAANEMLTTLTTLGRRIKSYAGDGSEGSDQRLAAFCSNAMVNLYVGASSELRKSIQAINELNTSLNGAADSGSEGLKALAAALAGSYTPPAESEDSDATDYIEDVE